MLKWPWAKNTILSCSGVAAKYTLIDSNWQQLYWSATLRDCEWLCEGEAEKKAPRALSFFKQCVYPVCEIWLCNYCKMGARAVFSFSAALIRNTILFLKTDNDVLLEAISNWSEYSYHRAIGLNCSIHPLLYLTDYTHSLCPFIHTKKPQYTLLIHPEKKHWHTHAPPTLDRAQACLP